MSSTGSGCAEIVQAEESVQQYVRLEQKVERGERVGLEARYEFGRRLLEERISHGGSKLPNGRLDAIAEATDISRRELQRRVQFAEEFPEIASALTQFRTWDAFVNRPNERPTRPTVELPEGAWPVLYVDPPWRYESPVTQSRAVENQYPTMELEEIKALEPPAAEDAVLFLWATSPMVPPALEVMEAWAFTYRTSMVWVKPQIGMGYYARQQHEWLLIGRRGDLPVPEPATRPPSVVVSPRTRHSEKPEQFYELIEAMYPEFRGHWFEMFARQQRDGWVSWGNELCDIA